MKFKILPQKKEERLKLKTINHQLNADLVAYKQQSNFVRRKVTDTKTKTRSKQTEQMFSTKSPHF